MSAAKAVVERLYKAINAHDLEAAARESAPDSVLTAPGDMTVKGPQAIKEYNQNWITAFPDAKIETQDIFAEGDKVAVKAQFIGTHHGTLKTAMGDVPATHAKVRGDFVQLFEIDRDLVKSAHIVFDQVQLMTQLGMAPAPPQPAGSRRLPLPNSFRTSHETRASSDSAGRMVRVRRDSGPGPVSRDRPVRPRHDVLAVSRLLPVRERRLGRPHRDPLLLQVVRQLPDPRRQES